MSYPLLNVFWTIFEVFLWITWFWILITDLRDRDIISAQEFEREKSKVLA